MTQGYTYIETEPRNPPLRPRVQTRISVVSCLKPAHWLIRSWGLYPQPQQHISAILHYTGCMDLDDLEWWGYTYGGLPAWLDRPKGIHVHGMSIQKYTPPDDSFIQKMINEGKSGLVYGPIEPLEVPKVLRW